MKIRTFNGECEYDYLYYDKDTGAHYVDDGAGLCVYCANSSRIGVDYDLKYKNTALEYSRDLTADEIECFNESHNYIYTGE